MGKFLHLLVFAACVASISYGHFYAAAQDYADSDDYGWGLTYKRSGFWSPHPSDYNPLRRQPHPVLRPSSKRDQENVFHPMARMNAMRQLQLRSADLDTTDEDFETRDKKHMVASKILYSGRTGSSSYPNVRRT